MYRAYIVTSEKVYDELGFKRCRPFVRFFYFFFFFPRTFFFPFLAFRIALFFSTINRILIPSFFFFFFPFHYHPSSRDDVTWISKRGSFEGTAFGSIVPQLVMYSAQKQKEREKQTHYPAIWDFHAASPSCRVIEC